MKTGIIVAPDGKTINDPLIYNSQTPHLLIDTRRESNKLLDLFEMAGGTALVSSGNIGPLEETLLTVKHGLKYVPRVTCSFYTHDAPAVTIVGHNPIGTFSSNFMTLAAVGAGVPVDYIYITVDDTYFKIIHHFEWNDLINGPTFTATSTANLWKITTKYMINNNSRKYPYTSSFTG